MIVSAECHFGVDPGAMQCTLHCSGNLLLGLSQSREFDLQFLSEAGAFRAHLVEKGLQIGALDLLGRLAKTLLPILATFHEMFHYANRIILVHDDLRQFRCSPRAEVWHDSGE